MQSSNPKTKINICFVIEIILFIVTLTDLILYLANQEEGSFAVAIWAMFLIWPLAAFSCVITPIIARLITRKELASLDKKSRTIAKIKLAFPAIAFALIVIFYIIYALASIAPLQ